MRTIWVVTLVFLPQLYVAKEDGRTLLEDDFKARADHFRTCIAEKFKWPGTLSPKNNDGPSALELDIGSYIGGCYGMRPYEIWSCPHLNVSFIHIFKSAGSTIREHLIEMCQPPFPNYIEVFTQMNLAKLNWKNWKRMLCDTALPYTSCESLRTESFTFVREPVSRFISGLVELAKRKNEWVLSVEQHAISTDRGLAAVAIEKLRALPLSKINTHVQPQSWFLTRCDNGMALPSLTHIGVVSPNLLRDTIKIMKYLSTNATRNAEFRPLPVHERDSRNSSYGEFSFSEKIHAETISQETEAQIREFYAVDYDCLGFA